MRPLLCTALAALIVLALSLQQSSTAQDKLGGEALQVAADNSKNALLTGTPVAFYNSLAPWMQQRIQLHRHEETAYLEGERKKDSEFARRYNAELKERLRGETGLDPAELAGVKSFDDAVKATPETAFAIEYGFFRLRGLERLKDNLTGVWFVVDRIVGTEIDDGVTRQVGRVRYCSAGYRDSIEVRCVREESGWRVVDVIAEFEDLRFSLADCAMTRNPLDARLEEAAAVEELRAGAEDSLREFRDAARAHWSQNQQVPKSLTKDCGVQEESLVGEWHVVRDRVYKQPGANRGGLVAQPAHGEGLMGWAILTFDYDGGQSRITWYQTEKDLDAALDEFQTEK